VLFIGGQEHGKFHDIPEPLPYSYVVMKDVPQKISFEDISFRSKPFEVVRYVLDGSGKQYVLEGYPRVPPFSDGKVYKLTCMPCVASASLSTIVEFMILTKVYRSRVLFEVSENIRTEIGYIYIDGRPYAFDWYGTQGLLSEVTHAGTGYKGEST
jgi:hypothetical protein